jgi:hypothetical protein
MIEQLNIPGLFRTVVEKVNLTFSTRVENPFSVHFYYGVHDVVKRQLQSLDQSITMKDMKYPMIWLVTPIDQDEPVGKDYAAELNDLTFLICTKSDATSSNDDRNTKFFEPYLRPIYHEFLKQIDSSYLFSTLSPNSIQHKVKEWPYHSGTGADGSSGKANLFDDFIDCIQIRRMKLQVNHSQQFVNT